MYRALTKAALEQSRQDALGELVPATAQDREPIIRRSRKPEPAPRIVILRQSREGRRPPEDGLSMYNLARIASWT